MSRAQLIEAREDTLRVLATLDALLAEAPANDIVAPPPPSVPVTPATAHAGLQKPDAFYAELRRTRVLGAEISPEEFAGCESLLAAGAGVLPLAWMAAVLGTAHWETGGVMAPNVENLNYTSAKRIRQVWPSRFPTEASAAPYVRNARALANKVYNGSYDARGQLVDRMGNRPDSDDGWTFRGRGQGHLTGRDNYERADEELGLGGSLVANPDRALEPDISARILVIGMRDGWFTGHRLNHFINNAATEAQFANSRPIINPDRNGPAMAKLCVIYRDALRLGDWR